MKPKKSQPTQFTCGECGIKHTGDHDCTKESMAGLFPETDASKWTPYVVKDEADWTKSGGIRRRPIKVVSPPTLSEADALALDAGGLTEEQARAAGMPESVIQGHKELIEATKPLRTPP